MSRERKARLYAFATGVIAVTLENDLRELDWFAALVSAVALIASIDLWRRNAKLAAPKRVKVPVEEQHCIDCKHVGVDVDRKPCRQCRRIRGWAKRNYFEPKEGA